MPRSPEIESPRVLRRDRVDPYAEQRVRHGLVSLTTSACTPTTL